MSHLLASALAGGAVFLALWQTLAPAAVQPAPAPPRPRPQRRARWEHRPRLKPHRA